MQTCFISYQREDKPIADRVYQRLKQHGIDVWMDKPPAPFRASGIPAGQMWDEMILTQLRGCFAFLPIFTDRAVPAESYFAKELKLASDLNATGQAATVILPVLSGVTQVPALPGGLSFTAFQWVDLLEDGLRAVLWALQPLLDTTTPTHEEITVRNGAEFIAAIGSNRTLLLDADEIDLTLAGGMPGGTAFVSGQPVHDGHQMTIHDVENLQIRPKGEGVAHLYVSPRYAFTVDFFQCRNIGMSRLRLGHQPERGRCAGGVLRGRNVSKLMATDCVLYGCGTQGFELYDCEQVIIDRCTVEECTSGLSAFQNCTGVAIRQSRFRANETTGVLAFENCRNVEVRETGFEDNTRKTYNFGPSAMIDARRSQEIWFYACWARGNVYDTVETTPGSVQFVNCRWDDFKGAPIR